MQIDDTSYADVLRIIGQHLDMERARRARVVECGDHLAVSWMSDNSGWRERDFPRGAEIDALRAKAQQQRSARWRGVDVSDMTWEERLRILGQELDREDLQLVELSEFQGSRISGTAEGIQVHHMFSVDELRSMSENRRAKRRAPSCSRGGWLQRLLFGSA